MAGLPGHGVQTSSHLQGTTGLQGPGQSLGPAPPLTSATLQQLNLQAFLTAHQQQQAQQQAQHTLRASQSIRPTPVQVCYPSHYITTLSE